MKIVLFALVKEGKVLVEKRPVKGFSKGLYLLPGGAVNLEENLEQTLVREMTEELGITPLEFKLLTSEDLPGLEENILKPFLVTSWSGEIPQFILDKEDPYPLEWIELTEFSKISVPETKKIVEILKEHLTIK